MAPAPPGLTLLDGVLERSAGASSRSLDLAGHGIELRFASPRLEERLLPALAHLLRPSRGQPEATVVVAEGDAMTAPPPWDWSRGVRRQEPEGWRDPDLRVAYNPDSGLLCLYRPSRRLGLAWTADAAALPAYEESAPLLQVLQFWAAGEGHQVVHAGALATTRGALLVAGPGGSGKSTLCASARDHLYLGDDYCLVAGDGQVHSLFCSLKLDPGSCERLGQRTAGRPLEDGKAMFLLPHRTGRAAPLRALVLPRLAAAPSLRPLAPGEAFRRLAPSTVMQLAGSGAEAMARLGRLVRERPCYALDLGPDPQANLALLEAL